MDTVVNYVSKNSGIHQLVVIIGLIKLTGWFFRLSRFTFEAIRNLKQNNLGLRYGQGSWAVVTGASDGIGLQFCYQLAEMEFNIVLISRTLEKLKNAQIQIKKKYPKVKTLIIAKDFSKASEKDFFDDIQQLTQNLDISFLVNNVGLDIFGPFLETSDEAVFNLLNVNCSTLVIMTKIFLEKFNQRGQKCGVLNVASFAGVVPCIYFHVYSATKSFVITFSKSLVPQFPNIDIMILKPNEVSTPMTYNRPTGIMTITAQQCARATLQDMGRAVETDGFITHKIQNWAFEVAPRFLFDLVLKNFIAPEWLEERRVGQLQRDQQKKEQENDQKNK